MPNILAMILQHLFGINKKDNLQSEKKSQQQHIWFLVSLAILRSYFDGILFPIIKKWEKSFEEI